MWRWPCLAARAYVNSSQFQPFSRLHCRMCNCPPCAAESQIESALSNCLSPSSKIHCRIFRCPFRCFVLIFVDPARGPPDTDMFSVSTNSKSNLITRPRSTKFKAFWFVVLFYPSLTNDDTERVFRRPTFLPVFVSTSLIDSLSTRCCECS